jgi:hypothetical protein
VRAGAAQALRPLIDADPASAPNFHEDAFWNGRIAKIKKGTTLKDVFTTLQTARRPTSRWYDWDGPVEYRLDDYWLLRLHGTRGQGNVEETSVRITRVPEVIPSAVHVEVNPPPNFTGKWTTWYVNGRKACEMEYLQGKFHGVLTRYHDNGLKSVEQHYQNGNCHGIDRGWYRGGRKMYQGNWLNGVMIGERRTWNQNGDLISIQRVQDGKLILIDAKNRAAEKADK